MTVEEIKAQCKTLSNEELYLIVTNRIRYDYVIVAVAEGEIKRRGLSKEEFREFKKGQAHRSKIIQGDIYQDLLFFEKLAFFFLCIPRLHYWVGRDYRRRGYILKIRQAQYYSVTGLISVFVSLIVLSGAGVLIGVCLIVWALTFLTAYLFNQYYFRERTIRRLAARMDVRSADDSQ